MPKVTVDVVVKHIESAVKDHVADISHRLAQNVHGFSQSQIMAAMGGKAEHLTSYLGNGSLVVSTPIKSVAPVESASGSQASVATPSPTKTAPATPVPVAPVESASGSQAHSGSGQ